MPVPMTCIATTCRLTLHREGDWRGCLLAHKLLWHLSRGKTRWSSDATPQNMANGAGFVQKQTPKQQTKPDEAVNLGLNQIFACKPTPRNCVCTNSCRIMANTISCLQQKFVGGAEGEKELDVSCPLAEPPGLQHTVVQ